jgi:hypothetical protein
MLGRLAGPRGRLRPRRPELGGRRDPLEKAALAATAELIAIAYAETIILS